MQPSCVTAASPARNRRERAGVELLRSSRHRRLRRSRFDSPRSCRGSFYVSRSPRLTQRSCYRVLIIVIIPTGRAPACLFHPLQTLPRTSGAFFSRYGAAMRAATYNCPNASCFGGRPISQRLLSTAQIARLLHRTAPADLRVDVYRCGLCGCIYTRAPNGYQRILRHGVFW